MRLRIQELPSRSIGEFYETPFVIVIDKAATPIQHYDFDQFIDFVKGATGATGVLVFDEEIELA